MGVRPLYFIKIGKLTVPVRLRRGEYRYVYIYIYD